MNSPGLRERKKQKTRWAIQEQALRLFQRQGYDGTTIDQIAAAAEISPSTFFRYFPSKEDLVIQDQYDELLMTGLKEAPPELNALAAIRAAAAAAFTAMGPEEEARLRERSTLVMSVPALRARSFENFLGTMDMLRHALAERMGRSADELEMRAFAGAIVGAMVGVVEVWLAENERRSLAELIDQVLVQLEKGAVP
jgi:AcrR family transcriptional regulator